MTSDIFSLEDDLGDITSSMSYSSWTKPITSVEELMSATNSTCGKEDEQERSDAYAALVDVDSANPDIPRLEEQQEEETKAPAVVAKESSKKSVEEPKTPDHAAAVPMLPLSSTDFLPDCGDTESLEKEVGNNDKIKEITIDYDSVQEEDPMYHRDDDNVDNDTKEAADSTKKTSYRHSLGTKFVKVCYVFTISILSLLSCLHELLTPNALTPSFLCRPFQGWGPSMAKLYHTMTTMRIKHSCMELSTRTEIMKTSRRRS